jgi:hypothetical protein
MRSVVGKAHYKLQLDLPLGEPDLVRSLCSSVSEEAIDPGTESFVTAPDPGHLYPPVPFPIGPESVVETHAEQAPRETKLPVGTATDPDRHLGAGDFHAPRASRNLTESSTGTDQDAATSPQQVSIAAWLQLLRLLRELRHVVDARSSVNHPLEPGPRHRHREHDHGDRRGGDHSHAYD